MGYILEKSNWRGMPDGGGFGKSGAVPVCSVLQYERVIMREPE